jgi:hypothetical protein
MRFITAIKQGWRNRWVQAVRTSGAIVLLSTVSVLGLALLGVEVFAAGKASDSSNPALASGTFEGVLNFDAPATTVARLEAQSEEATKSKAQANSAPVLLKNWKFTQNPTMAEAYQLSYFAYQQGMALAATEERYDALPLSHQVQLYFDQLYTAYYNVDIAIQAYANQFLPPTLRPPALPPASPTL